jgi:23S rRNA (adenine2503-C2)-methyltransferase
MNEMTDIKSYNLIELQQYIESIGEKKFRAEQIYKWLHVDRVESFDEMTNISKTLRGRLADNCDIRTIKKHDVLVSNVDGTRKYLFEISGGSIIESVFMRYHHGNSVCISTQSGCRMGCRFCASTLNGLERNLTTSELLEQVYQIEEDTGEKVSNVVLMGSGEPMDNFDNVVRFIEMISDKHGANISQRNITLSTCGIVPKIYELAEKKYQITLALSLHASDNETRKSLMPIANKYSIDEVMKACRDYFDVTGRRITFEYSLVAGENDSVDEADRLSRLIKGINCHVNLIPVNPIKERNYTQSGQKAIVQFKSRLEKNNINVTIRREMGRDINGACGQLRNEAMKERKEDIDG